MKRPVPPPSLARVKAWEGGLVTPRSPVVVPVVRSFVLSLQKDAPVRDEAYRRYVASQECFACGIAGLTQAAHPNFGKALSMKTDDRLCFPLCGPSPLRVGCHTQHDLCIDMTRDERRERETNYVARMRLQARADGWR